MTVIETKTIKKANMIRYAAMIGDDLRLDNGCIGMVTPEMAGEPPASIAQKYVCAFSKKDAQDLAGRLGFPKRDVLKIERPMGQHEWFVVSLMAGCYCVAKWDGTSDLVDIVK